MLDTELEKKGGDVVLVSSIFMGEKIKTLKGKRIIAEKTLQFGLLIRFPSMK